MKKSLLILCLIGLALAACSSKSKYISAPVESCQSSYTGRTQSVEEVYYICASYNAQGLCSVNVPQFYTVVYKEVRTTCDFLEMRS